MLRTSHQRMVLCRTCPIAKVADLVGDSVSIIILRDLIDKPRRFTDLELALAGVSSRTLTLKLRSSKRSDFCPPLHPPTRQSRRVPADEKGRGLPGVVDAMRAYGKGYL